MLSKLQKSRSRSIRHELTKAATQQERRGITCEGAVGVIQEGRGAPPLRSRAIVHHQHHVTVYDGVQPAQHVIHRLYGGCWLVTDARRDEAGTEETTASSLCCAAKLEVHMPSM